jgi:GntR family transcriptional regulator/MocR family aminotransferase
MAEGYIYSIPKKGYFVSEIISKPTARKFSVSENSKPVTDSRHFVSDSRQMETSKNSIHAVTDNRQTDFGLHQSNPENFPFSLWVKLMREIMAEKSSELMSNPPCGGTLELREAIAGHLLQFRGMKVLPEQIIIGAGTEYLYGILIQLFGFDRIFAVEDPGYHKIASIYRSHHVKCCHIPLDKEGIDIQRLEASEAEIVHISPSHHYPTGIVTSISRRYELLGWALRAKNRYIIEDDYDSEFRLSGKPIPTMQSMDVSEKVIYMNTFTKSLASTIRISYMVLPQHLLCKFYDTLGFYACTVSNFEQYTLAKFIRDGHFEKHINRMRTIYRNERNHILETIRQSPLNAIAAVMEEDSGLHFLIRLNTEIPDFQLHERALQSGIRLSFLSQYYFGQHPDAEHVIVMNYSAMNTAQAEEYIQKLCDCLFSTVPFSQHPL